MDSIWVNDIKKPKFQSLAENKNTDVLIIGGGMAGILSAYFLKKAGVNAILVEADEICNGITRDTTAKITFAHGLLYDKLIRRYGKDYAKLYLQAQLGACKKYEELCKNIECDYQNKSSYVYSTSDRKKIEKEVKALNDLGINARFLEEISLPFKVKGAIKVEKQAQFHPLKFIFEISKGLEIYENTKVLEIMTGKAVTQNGTISCDKMIIATHFPIVNKHGSYFLKMYQHRSYVIALKNAPNVNGMYVDESDKGLSFRNYDDYLLLGGGGHRTGKTGGNWQELETFAKNNYKGAKIVAKWATQDCITLDRVAYIGRYSKNTPQMYVATGFNKWGMTSSMAAAMLLSDLVLNKRNEYESVFSPSRSILQPQLAINAFESITGLLTPTKPRCSHLGCALKYNKAEHSWDCSCHGSRFTENGKLINNPATDDKKM